MLFIANHLHRLPRLQVNFWESRDPCVVVVSVLVSGLIGVFSGGRLLEHLRHFSCFL